MNNYFDNHSDEYLRDIYKNEYLPWAKTGVLEDGVLRSASHELEEQFGVSELFFEQFGVTSLIIVEKVFIGECAKRFANQ
jgi:hypothetical protein